MPEDPHPYSVSQYAAHTMEKYTLKPFSSESTLHYKKNLNEPQQKVVEEAEGPSLVLAGAGSGKTRVLIYRLAYLLERGVNPKNILLVTFTNKASHEMIHRAEALLKTNLTGLWAGTFHHIGNVILRREAEQIGYSPNFSIIDRQDAKDLIEDCLEHLGYLKREKLFPKKDLILNIRGLASSTRKKIPDVIKEFYSQVEEYTPQIQNILDYYRKKKKKANVMDFDDLLEYWFELLQDKETCLKYARMFRYILVDEYQDTNRIQFQILKKLSSVHHNILAVGDDAQSIYSFRGAEIDNILDFPNTFEGAKIFKLQINYRSVPQILELSNEIIQRNVNQFPKKLEAIKKDGDRPAVVKTHDVYQQAKFIAQRIMELIREGIALNEQAVLFRSRFQALEIEVELMKRNIPYVVRGGVRFFEQSHIKDILSYLKVILNPKDELSFKRALCLHKGIGRGYAQRIWERFSRNEPLRVIGDRLPRRAKQGYEDFAALFGPLQKIKSPQDAITHLLTFYKDYCYVSFDNPEERILDLEELAKMASNYPTVKRFLLEFSSYEDFKGETMLSPSEKDDLLILSTIHQAKGLEWETVFLIGFNDYDFPHPKALNSQRSLEEERRLFYVAATRAKSLLYVTYPETKFSAKNGLIIARPSSFYYELPPSTYENWELEDSTGPGFF
ncbi:MAG: AAA family ATPase [Candidatus Omnitrophica bacterium]|nr:AAA family ATPase [Candidatus Omnitrophota bacterium]